MLKLPLWHLLCVGLLLAQLPGDLGAQGTGGRPVASTGDYGVRLCGREFIRAVIFTCGGSRWKRLSLEAEAPDSPGEQQQSVRRTAGSLQETSNKDLDSLKMPSSWGSEVELQVPRTSMAFGRQSAKDIFNTYDEYNEYAPVSDDLSEYIRQVEESASKTRSPAGAISAGGPERFPWVKSPRRKRDYSIGVAGMCCKWGCTKSEISALC